MVIEVDGWSIDHPGRWMVIQVDGWSSRFGLAHRLAMCTFESIVINGSSILPSKTVRNLGVVLDPSLSLASHVIKLTSTLYFHIRQLRTIRRTLTNDACHALVRGPRSFEAGLLQWAPCQSTRLSSGSTVRCDACCCQTHPPATSKKSRF